MKHFTWTDDMRALPQQNETTFYKCDYRGKKVPITPLEKEKEHTAQSICVPNVVL